MPYLLTLCPYCKEQASCHLAPITVKREVWTSYWLRRNNVVKEETEDQKNFVSIVI